MAGLPCERGWRGRLLQSYLPLRRPQCHRDAKNANRRGHRPRPRPLHLLLLLSSTPVALSRTAASPCTAVFPHPFLWLPFAFLHLVVCRDGRPATDLPFSPVLLPHLGYFWPRLDPPIDPAGGVHPLPSALPCLGRRTARQWQCQRAGRGSGPSSTTLIAPNADTDPNCLSLRPSSSHRQPLCPTACQGQIYFFAVLLVAFVLVWVAPPASS